MLNVRMSPLEESHLPDILKIENASQSVPWSEHSFRHELNHTDGIFVVAETNEGVIGYASAWMTADEIHITTVAVHPDHRNQGIGRKVIVELLSQGVSKDGSCATLEVRPSNLSAIALYESLGFKSVGRRKNYYPDNKEDAFVMWLYDLTEYK